MAPRRAGDRRSGRGGRGSRTGAVRDIQTDSTPPVDSCSESPDREGQRVNQPPIVASNASASRLASTRRKGASLGTRNRPVTWIAAQHAQPAPGRQQRRKRRRRRARRPRRRHHNLLGRPGGDDVGRRNHSGGGVRLADSPLGTPTALALARTAILKLIHFATATALMLTMTDSAAASWIGALSRATRRPHRTTSHDR
jgi:hypothetical protein